MKLPFMFQWPIRRHYCCDYEPDWTFSLQWPVYRRPVHREYTGHTIPPEALNTMISDFKLLSEFEGIFVSSVATMPGPFGREALINVSNYERVVAWPVTGDDGFDWKDGA